MPVTHINGGWQSGMAKSANHAVKIEKVRLEDAARRFSTAALAADALNININSFRRACNQYGIKWRTETGWDNLTSRKYEDRCGTKGCRYRPSSRGGLCFRCYALTKS